MMRYTTTHYKVTWGDTLEGIALKFNIDPDVIKYSNNARDLYVGLILNIPNQPLYLSEDKKVFNQSLEYYFRRHLSKKHYFKFNV